MTHDILKALKLYHLAGTDKPNELNDLRGERDMWRRRALGLPGTDGKTRFPRPK